MMDMVEAKIWVKVQHVILMMVVRVVPIVSQVIGTGIILGTVIEDMNQVMMIDVVIGEMVILVIMIEDLLKEVAMTCVMVMTVGVMEAVILLVVIHILAEWMIGMEDLMGILAGRIRMPGIRGQDLVLVHDLAVALVHRPVEGIVFLLMVVVVDISLILEHNISYLDPMDW